MLADGGGHESEDANVIDLTQEAPLPLADACRLVPPARKGRKTHLSTLLRWISRGARSPSGECIRLEALRIGGRWMTSREALQRFAERLTPLPPDFGGATPPSMPRTPTARQRASARAGKELERFGI
jgi:hypothetical protein